MGSLTVPGRSKSYSDHWQSLRLRDWLWQCWLVLSDFCTKSHIRWQEHFHLRLQILNISQELMAMAMLLKSVFVLLYSGIVVSITIQQCSTDSCVFSWLSWLLSSQSPIFLHRRKIKNKGWQKIICSCKFWPYHSVFSVLKVIVLFPNLVLKGP